MAKPVPQKPQRQYSFRGHSLSSPAVPHSGTHIDTEIDRNAEAINEIIDFVRQAISDDGRIRSSALGAALVGQTGPQGPSGPEGPEGPVGPAGPEGPQGAPGSTGPRGEQGVQGPAGQSFTPDVVGELASRSNHDSEPEGFSFLAVDDGRLFFKRSEAAGHWTTGIFFGRGQQGIQGIQGIEGPTGPTGPQGPIGPTGQQGPVGPIGPQGLQGTLLHYTTGAPSAAVGNEGDLALNASGEFYKKENGVWDYVANLTGPQGVQGAIGPVGATGAKGETGDVGPQGPTGPVGPAGNMDGGNNLSELTNLAQARSNLGLGSIALSNLTVSATAPASPKNGDIWMEV